MPQQTLPMAAVTITLAVLHHLHDVFRFFSKSSWTIANIEANGTFIIKAALADQDDDENPEDIINMLEYGMGENGLTTASDEPLTVKSYTVDFSTGIMTIAVQPTFLDLAIQTARKEMERGT